MPSRLSSTLIGSGLIEAVAHYHTAALISALCAVGVELLIFFNDGLG